MTGGAQPFRLAQGGIIDRARPVRFTFDGARQEGFAGDTLAAALLANGIRLVARSFKYHRPRGILSAGPEEPNALATLRHGARREPNTRMTVAELYDGMAASSQNAWPSLRFDLLSVNALLAPIFAAGFYYKTFMWPAAFWEKLYEPMIRRAAGLGRASTEADPDSYEKQHAFCDVLVIGGGPAGLSAALQAARTGARVLLCDEDFAIGGQLLRERRQINAAPAHDWLRASLAELATFPEFQCLPRTTVFGAYDGGTYGAVERVSDHLPVPPPGQPRQRYWKITARRTILATGAIERPLVFPGNDVPGVMLAGAVRAYLNRFAVLPGATACVFANNDDAARTLADLAHAGVRVAAWIDPRPQVPAGIMATAEAAGARIFAASVVARTHASPVLHAITIRDSNGVATRLPCDLLAMSGGWNPNLALSTHLGGKPNWNSAIAAFIPGDLPPGMATAGASHGAFALADALAAGAQAGRAAAAACGRAEIALPNDFATDPDHPAITPLWRVPGRGKAFVDFQNDVAATDVDLAAREGFTAVEHLKRYTTLGMATDQGKTANVNGLALMAEITEKTIPQVGSTRFRPPYTPVAAGALAGPHRGSHFRPTRLTPTHAWAASLGAVFVDAGPWKRAQYFPRDGEADWLATVSREVLAVRHSVGFCDVSTLGKIDIQGADAAVFLERIYTNAWRNLAPGRARYGLMLREDGFVFDDGTTARLGQDHYIMTTTTANAGRVFEQLEFCRQALWPELDVHLASVTDQWAQLAIAGPKARDVLRTVIDAAHDFADAAFPHMQAGEITICGGIPARLFRLSFSGERAYELAVPARYGASLADRLMQVGAPFGITPYGTEALGVLRIEKGHPAGAELNGQTTAHDLGLGRLLSTRKDFIGRVMANRPALTDLSRPTLVGLRPTDPKTRLRAGAHLLPRGTPADAAHDEGWISSVAYSPTLQSWIALGFLQHGPARHGQIVRAYDPVRGGDADVAVVQPVFVDPEGDKLRG